MYKIDLCYREERMAKSRVYRAGVTSIPPNPNGERAVMGTVLPAPRVYCEFRSRRLLPKSSHPTHPYSPEQWLEEGANMGMGRWGGGGGSRLQESRSH